MNGAHLHLLLNHFPLIGFLFGFIFLVLGHFLSNQDYGRSGLIILIFSGILAVPTYLSGDPAEHTIDKMPTFSEDILSPHEDAAEFAIWFISATAITAAGALWMSVKKHRKLSLVMKAVAVLNLFTLTVIARTNYLGGQISHVEIRDGGPSKGPAKVETSGNKANEAGEKEQKENH